MKLSVIIPCYNEAKNLPLILEEFSKVIERDDIEIIIVNNGSTDESVAELTKLAPNFRFLKIITVPMNQGYGFGILAGLREATGEFIGWTHGDLQTPPADILKALAIIETEKNQGNLYLKGKRKGRPLGDRIFTLGMTIFESIYLGKFLFDINAQPNIFNRSFFESWVNPPHDFALDLYAFYLAKKQSLKIVRFPVFFNQRIHGSSNWNTDWRAKWQAVGKTMTYSFKLKKILV